MKTDIFFHQSSDIGAVQSVVPWLAPVNDHVIVNKDGSLLMGFEFSGLDPDNTDNRGVNLDTDLLHESFSVFDDRFIVYGMLHKRECERQAPDEFDNESSKYLDSFYQKQFEKAYEVKYQIFILFTGNTGSHKFFDRVSRIAVTENKSMPQALAGAIIESISGAVAYRIHKKDIDTKYEELTRAVDAFSAKCPFKLTSMRGDTFIVALSSLVNLASKPFPRKLPANALIDSWIGTNYINYKGEAIQFKGDSTKYLGAIGIKKFENAKTNSRIFEDLAKINSEFSLVIIMRMLGQSGSEAAINAAYDYFKLNEYNPISHALSKLSGSEPEANPGVAKQLGTLDDMKEQGVRLHCIFNFSVLVLGKSVGEVDKRSKQIIEFLNKGGITAIRERLNTQQSFLGSLPGGWNWQSRWDTIDLTAATHMFPKFSINEGDAQHNYYSKIYGKPLPNLISTLTEYGTRCRINTHKDDVGHMAIIAPTGGGKTTAVSLFLSQHRKYPDSRLIILDRDRSCEPVTRTHGGVHVNISKDSSRWNPCVVLKDGTDDGKRWFAKWIADRIETGSFQLDGKQKDAIAKAIDSLMVQSEESWCLTAYLHFLSEELAVHLNDWIQGGSRAVFDATEDQFSLSDWTTIEMSEILKDEEIGLAFLDYFFYRTYHLITNSKPVPTVIYLEEVPFLLDIGRGRKVFCDWLTTFRKKQASIWFTLQSVQRLTHPEIFNTVADNVFTFLFTKNKTINKDRDVLTQKLGFQDYQVDQIEKLNGIGNYIMVKDGVSYKLKIHLQPEVLAFLRSEKFVLDILDRYIQQIGAENMRKDMSWLSPYISEVTKRENSSKR